MSNINWTYVHSYEEALLALDNGAQNITTYKRKRLVEYKGNEYSFSNFIKTLAGNQTIVCLRYVTIISSVCPVFYCVPNCDKSSIVFFSNPCCTMSGL